MSSDSSYADNTARSNLVLGLLVIGQHKFASLTTAAARTGPVTSELGTAAAALSVEAMRNTDTTHYHGLSTTEKAAAVELAVEELWRMAENATNSG